MLEKKNKTKLGSKTYWWIVIDSFYPDMHLQEWVHIFAAGKFLSQAYLGQSIQIVWAQKKHELNMQVLLQCSQTASRKLD